MFFSLSLPSPLSNEIKMGEILEKKENALAGVAQWIECQPVNQRVPGSILSWGTYLCCRPGPQWGACERQPHIDVSLPLFLTPFPSLSKSMNKIF